MKKPLFIGIISLLLLCSCSVEHTISKYRPRSIGSYELVSYSITYETEIYTLSLYDKKGKLKDSVRFHFDIESQKPKRIDRNGNMRINVSKYSGIVQPKYVFPKFPEI